MFYVEVQEYNPEWPKQFRVIKKELKRILRGTPYKGIEHVGSTSVPGLAAKPIIDIDIIAADDNYWEVLRAIREEGTYREIGQMGITDRYVIRHSEQETIQPQRNIYVCIEGGQPLRNHLAVRNACRANPELRDKYGQRKLELSTLAWEDTDVHGYNKAKTDVLMSILREGGFEEEELKKIRELNGCLSK